MLVVGPEMLQDSQRIIETICQRLRAAQDIQRLYVNQRHNEVRFAPRDPVLLKVSVTFGKQGKLSLRYVGPFEVLDRVGEVAYRLALPPNLSAIHPVFYVSMMRRYVPDQSQQIYYEELKLQPNLSYEEDVVSILDRCSKTLHQKELTLIKVL